MSNKAAIEKAEQLIAKEESVERYSLGGQWLPLGVWAQRGFDADRIKDRSLQHNVREDPLLGTVYRVPILETVEEGRRTTSRVSTLMGAQFANLATRHHRSLSDLLERHSPLSSLAWSVPLAACMLNHAAHRFVAKLVGAAFAAEQPCQLWRTSSGKGHRASLAKGLQSSLSTLNHIASLERL